jgi:hypothetical protein
MVVARMKGGVSCTFGITSDGPAGREFLGQERGQPIAPCAQPLQLLRDPGLRRVLQVGVVLVQPERRGVRRIHRRIFGVVLVDELVEGGVVGMRRARTEERAREGEIFHGATLAPRPADCEQRTTHEEQAASRP